MIWNIGAIGRKLLIISLVSTIIPLTIVGLMAVWYQSSDIKKQTLTTLEIIADNTVREIEQYINNLKERTLDFGSDGFIRDAVEKINRNDPSSNQIVRDLNNYIIHNKKPIIPDAIETCVLNLKGIVIASSDMRQTGSDHSQTEYFRMGLQGTCASDIAQSPQSQQPLMVISTPLTSMIDGTPLGVIVNRISIERLSRITTALPEYLKDIESPFKRIGSTGETYIVNGSKLMVTESRFIDDVILKQVVDTEPVRLALEQDDIIKGEYLDYRGVPILGASKILNEMNWVILAEIDKDEALTPIHSFIARAAILGGSVGAVFIILPESCTVKLKRQVKTIELPRYNGQCRLLTH